MKLLLDACVWGRAADTLRTAGHDVVWVGNWAEDPGDDAVLAFAHSEERVCVTIDKDFGELAVRRRIQHHGIVRIAGFSVRHHAEVCEAVVSAHGDELLQGALVTAEPGRIRIRPAETE